MWKTLTRQEVFDLWKLKKMGAIPRIVMNEKDFGCWGDVVLEGSLVGKGSICSRYSDALSSAKRWRVIFMARMLYPNQKVYVK